MSSTATKPAPAGASRTRSVLLEALPLAAIVLIATVVASNFALGLSEFVIMPDELGYVKQAIVMSHGELPTQGSFWFNSWALAHSALLAPLYRFFSTTTAFDVGHVIGALTMSSAAIPAYLIARRILDWRRGALFAAALTVAVPWLGMAGTMMTEVVAYPVFVWVCLAMLYGIVRPGLRGDVIVAVALAVAFVSRTQLLILAPAYVLALAVDVLLRREDDLRTRVKDAVRTHAPMIIVVAAGTLIVLATGSLKRVLGGYADPVQGSLLPPGTGVAMRELVVYVIVAIGAVPLAMAAAWALTTLGRRVTRDQHAFAALLVTVIPVLAVIGGSFTVRFTAGINDRYFFYVVPLLVIGAIAAVDHRRRGFLPVLAGTGALTVWLLASAAISQQGPSLVSPSMAAHTWLAARAQEAGLSMPHLIAIGTAVALIGVVAIAKLLPPRIAVTAVGTALLIWGVVETGYTLNKIAATQKGVSPAFLAQRGWVDRALPKNGRAIEILASVGDPVTSTAVWWDTVFWNKSVDKILTMTGGDSYGQGFVAGAEVDPRTGRVPALDRYQYVVRFANDTRFGLRGSNTVGDSGGIIVLTADRPYQAEWLFKGPDPNAATVPPEGKAGLTLFAPGKSGPGTVAVTLLATGAKPAPVTVGRKHITIKPGARATVTVPVTYSAPGRARLPIRAGKTDAAVTLIAVEHR